MAKVILLPELPPPLSACYRNANGPGRVKTSRYKAWIEAMGWALPSFPIAFEGDLRAEYRFLRPNRRRQDVANREKATSDLLTHLGVIHDDSQIVDLRLMWVDELPAPVEIRIWKAG